MDTRQELAKQAQKANVEDIKTARALEQMLKSEGWEAYQRLLQSQIEQRQQAVLEPIGPGMRDASEHNKGALYGMIWARDIASVTVITIKEQLKVEAARSSKDLPEGE